MDAVRSLVVVLIISALAPFISDLLPGRIRIPQVVILLVGGILVGPQLLAWSVPADIELFSTAGMAFLFLLAGYELDLAVFRQRSGRLSIWTWVTSLIIGVAAMLGLYAAGVIDAPVVLAIALSTTALGTILPILRENGLLGGSLGTGVFAVGAVGELGPILAMAIFLGGSGSLTAIILVVLFIGLVIAAAVIPWRKAPGRIQRIVALREHSTGQLTLRIVIAVLFTFLLISEEFGFESVLGAFAAGMVLRRWATPGQSTLPEKLDAVAYGLFIPIFFVYSGMTLDVLSIMKNPLPLFIFLAFLLVIRGGPMLWWFRNEFAARERFSLALFGSTTLPLLVALTAIGVTAGHLSTGGQASVIGAGVVSVLVFPIIAVELARSRKKAATATGSGPGSGRAPDAVAASEEASESLSPPAPPDHPRPEA